MLVHWYNWQREDTVDDRGAETNKEKKTYRIKGSTVKVLIYCILNPHIEYYTIL